MELVESLDSLLKYEPEALIPLYSQPIVNKADIENVINPYRDTVKFAHDQAVRYLNKGK